MHKAYEARIVLERFPLDIESIVANDGNLVVGTKQGHLFMYSITSDSLMRTKITLLRSNRNFSHKPITQIAVVPEHQILIALSDQTISVHDLTIFNFPLLGTLSKTKGASCFDTDIKHYTSLTGERFVNVRLVVAVRKKLQFFYWKARQFLDLREDITLIDVPKTLCWCGEGVLIALKNDYYLVKQLTSQQIELNIGKCDRHYICSLPGGGRSLYMESKLGFVDANGEWTEERTTNWPDVPAALAFDDPYWLAVLPKGIQVSSLDPLINVQFIPLDNVKLIISSYSTNRSQRQVFVASASNIWILCAIPFSHQIPDLLKNYQFDLALRVADLCSETKSSKSHIKKLQAVHYFCEGKYTDAMKLFFALNSDLLFVIGLFPALVPEECRAKLRYPQTIPVLEGKELEEALRELIHFLLQMRHSIKSQEKSSNSSPHSLEVYHQKLQIIGTTLLKCYLKTNDALIESLLRMPDNHVNLEEGERILRQAHKYSELVLLLKNRKEHSKALELLFRHSKRPDSPLNGHTHTINYLRELVCAEHIDVIFEYGSWVLRNHPSDGLQIFLESGGDSCDEIEMLPRPRILNFIKKTNSDLTVPYLEHLVYECGDKNPVIHNELVYQYKEILSDKTIEDEQERDCGLKVPREDVQKKLLEFLRNSKSYTAATLLVHFPQDDLFEERAILLGRLGQHKQALQIFTDVLKDVDKALEYCESQSNLSSGESIRSSSSPSLGESRKNQSQIYLIFLKLLLSKTDHHSEKFTAVTSYSHRAGDDGSLSYWGIIQNILRNYSHCLDLSEVLRIFPVDSKVHVLKDFILRSMVRMSRLRKDHQVLRGLTQAVLHEVESCSKSSENQKIFLSEKTICSICRKRFTNSSAFAWHSSGEILHFMCNEQRNLKR